jgi:uncharacterized protein (TIGR02996 family)
MASGEERGADVTEEEILRALAAAPGDRDARSVYADWLEERGRVDRAEQVRRLTRSPAPCLTCAHFEWSWLGADRCDGFREGIPHALLRADELHDVPREGDGGLVYAPATDANAGAERRHDAWGRLPLRRASRAEDALGAAVSYLESGMAIGPLLPSVAGQVRAAWPTAGDAIAAFVVALRVGATDRALYAIDHARVRLELEHCDALDNKAWSGASQMLEDARRRLARGELTGLAALLGAKQQNDYVEARLHRMILHGLRLGWTEGPTESELGRWQRAPDLGWGEQPSFLEEAGPARGGVAPT